MGRLDRKPVFISACAVLQQVSEYTGGPNPSLHPPPRSPLQRLWCHGSPWVAVKVYHQAIRLLACPLVYKKEKENIVIIFIT